MYNNFLHSSFQGNSIDFEDQIESSPSPRERSRFAMHHQDPIDEFDDYMDDPNEENYTDSYNPGHPHDYDEYEELECDLTQFNAPSDTRHHYPPLTTGRPRFQASAVHYDSPRTRPPSPSSSRGANPLNSTGIRLTPISDLPDMYRGIFKFPVFNAVQSTCFSTVFSSDENLIVSAPTGSGKTVLFELAIIRMLKEVGSNFKCVYMAPTKALCSERQRDWSTKFASLGIKCCELTGDTVQFGKGVWGDAKAATIIITTGEKWDSLTRNWSEHGHILSRVQLFLVDEVHILNESRGSTLEVVISRMKSRGSSVRFLLVSATVPNIQDIASWIGDKRREGPAIVFEFNESFRPCKLKRHVIAIDRARSDNDFSFARKIDHKLFPTLQAHAVGKPILVFVSTRKGVTTTAKQLMTDYVDAEKSRKQLPWSHAMRNEYVFHDQALNEFSKFGIGIHHAGMTMDDRRGVEDLYLRGALRVVVATSTLAVGVNLPAHTVVIKGVHIFQNNQSGEYSDLDVMQMLGRAGRPQFDTDGVAIIMCETELENKYRELAQGKTTVESSLHLNLAEHINSEIGLGTITSMQSAKSWLRSSFLFQRVKKNPAHYSLGKTENQSWEERIDEMVIDSIGKLRSTQLINDVEAGINSDALASTEFGDIMSKFYIRQSTMSLILALPEKPTLRELIFNKLRRHNDIRFEVKKVEKSSDKIFLLIQAVLSGISLNSPDYKAADSQLNLEAFAVFKHVSRIARVIVEVALVRKRGAQLKHGLELVRCLTAKAWEDRPVVLKQIESIGEKSIKVLAENGITTLALLAKQDAHKIENVAMLSVAWHIIKPVFQLLNRRPPFGLEILAAVNEIPKYHVDIAEVGVHSNGGKDPVEIDLAVTCGLTNKTNNTGKLKKQKWTQMTSILTLTSDLELVDFRRIPTKALKDAKKFEITAELTKPSQSVMVLITSESIAGATVSQAYKPNLSYTEYPTRDTRPPTALDLDLAGLEDDPEFWNTAVDAEGNFEEPLKQPILRDLTQTHTQKKSTDPPASSASGPEKLSNGNYKCNHPCKDKTKCRHLCCRDGLPELPRAAKRRLDDNPKPAEPIAAKKPSKVTNKPDKTIQQLEQLHESTKANLKLVPGSRLKLESPDELKRKNKVNLDFSVKLSDLKDKESLPTSFPRLQLDDDDDDLPEPQELVQAAKSGLKRQRNSSPDYSDSELDSMIRHVPSETMKFKSPKRAHTPKRKNRNEENFRPLKKVHREDVAPSPESASNESHDHSMAYYDVQPLFNFAEDFQYGTPEVELTLPSTPSLTDDDRKTISDMSQPVATPDAPAPMPTQKADGPCNEDTNEDLMALDEWLNSGAVEIV
ncbi:DEAD/DEAH-box DNA helicase [Mycena indigotica]|uniref:DNA 3'-5' helicase n=1 Tax=Mycena indigotica TaxID=2126181 RepID=A0A8H6VVB6_9AGAR|nr:DEAD/DEAH-box DNA helicase [Mycena indigotica]KAF7295289.1 DEAD/DEAH-box DNA helicase [Mycena indigotica]